MKASTAASSSNYLHLPVVQTCDNHTRTWQTGISVLPMPFLKLFEGQISYVEAGIVMKKNHISDQKFASFLLICMLCLIQYLAVIAALIVVCSQRKLMCKNSLNIFLIHTAMGFHIQLVFILPKSFRAIRTLGFSSGKSFHTML